MRWGIIFIIILFFAGPLYAHKVSVYAYVEAGHVYVEGYFVDGTKVKNATVDVLRADTGEKLLTGKTDRDGRFSFKVPGPYPLKIVLKASMGHRNEYLLKKTEILEALSETNEAGNVEESAETEGDAVQQPGPQIDNITAKDLDALLRRHIEPLREELREIRFAQERPSLRDVIGGLGYIAGLAGIYLYMRSKRD